MPFGQRYQLGVPPLVTSELTLTRPKRPEGRVGLDLALPELLKSKS